MVDFLLSLLVAFPDWKQVQARKGISELAHLISVCRFCTVVTGGLAINAGRPKAWHR